MASAERFGYEWDIFRIIIPEYEEQFLKWIKPLTNNDFKDKIILDAGCGIGRNSYWPLKYGARRVLAFDFDRRTVRVAKSNLREFSNAKVIYRDIYKTNEVSRFDIAHAIGVIQHLRKPDLAISNLARATKKGGIVLIWVLGKEGNGWIEFFVTPLRKITSKAPIKLVDALSYFLTVPVFVFAKFSHSKHPYFMQLSKYGFQHIRSIVFDHLIPEVVHYYSKKEARRLLEKAGLKNIRENHINNNSWTVIGTKI